MDVQNTISIHPLPSSGLDRIGEVDRSEFIAVEYVRVGDSLERREINVQVPPWSPDGDHDHSIHGRIAAWRPILERGGVLLGALNGESLVGFAVFEPDLEPRMDHLAVLYVSQGYRGRGVGGLLTREMIRMARSRGARRLYVSSSATVATVEFYRSHGFELAREPNARLLRAEPDDIHMVRQL